MFSRYPRSSFFGGDTEDFSGETQRVKVLQDSLICAKASNPMIVAAPPIALGSLSHVEKLTLSKLDLRLLVQLPVFSV